MAQAVLRVQRVLSRRGNEQVARAKAAVSAEFDHRHGRRSNVRMFAKELLAADGTERVGLLLLLPDWRESFCEEDGAA